MIDVQNFSENVDYSAHWTNTITQRIYIISFIRSMLFFRRILKFLHIQRKQFFKECRIFYALNKHYYSWSLYNFFTFKICNFLKNAQYFAHLTYTIFKWCLIFHAFKEHYHLKILQNIVSFKYSIFWRMLEILLV